MTTFSKFLTTLSFSDKAVWYHFAFFCFCSDDGGDILNTLYIEMMWLSRLFKHYYDDPHVLNNVMNCFN
jgi:hypothetical protein